MPASTPGSPGSPGSPGNSPGTPPPTALSLILCEKVITDARTKQHSLIGIISHAQVAGFPARMASVFIFVELTDGRGRTPITLRIVDVDETRPPVIQLDLEVEIQSPLAVNQFVFGTPPLAFPEPGNYRVQALSGGTLIIERQIMLRRAEQKGQEGPNFGQA